ncbi:exopolyphosphatase [Paenibacillus sp. N3.4]|uniref:Ppx/GppA phosphatase family protein n=1 Tax=Paenibacillus sp. N3.4 TaxID=2603222 RepID=UPI0011CB82E9|nr:exopolyphosphatase [Paenibacillus sp. N3.4]TXK84483.1 exopolyphosphatase [Paenibacillus sp. N3.4]
MYSNKLILDLGSHSAKVFRRCDNQIEQVDVATWELLESEVNLPDIEGKLKYLLSTQSPFIEELEQGAIEAIGTEAMRRSPLLSEHMNEVCNNLRIAYRTISQKEEAELLMRTIADSDIPVELDVMNIGGGSIQIITRTSEVPYFLPFGISDLNQQFGLLKAPNKRQVSLCVKWVTSRMPPSLNTFAYTGGEKTFLRHFNIELEEDLYCQRGDLIALTERLAGMEMTALEAQSPFDPHWMHGALASNCIVLAGLIRSGASRFMPSDLNIAHGFLKQI